VFLCSFVHIGLWRRVREKKSKNRSFPGFVRSFLDQARSRLESRLVGVCQPPMYSTYFTIWSGTKAVTFIKSSLCEFEEASAMVLKDETTRSTARRVPDDATLMKKINLGAFWRSTIVVYCSKTL